jgi:hypothetical protein
MTSSPITDEANTVICGVEQPKRIWLMCYRHAGDVCWTTDPNPEDADEIETVEYARADLMRSSAPPVMGMEEMVAKMRSAFMSGWLTRHSSEEQPEAAFQVYLEAHGLSTPLVTGRE